MDVQMKQYLVACVNIPERNEVLDASRVMGYNPDSNIDAMSPRLFVLLTGAGNAHVFKKEEDIKTLNPTERIIGSSFLDMFTQDNDGYHLRKIIK